MLLTIQPKEFDMFIGVDVDKKSYATTYRDHNGEGRSLKMPASPEYFYRYFEKRFPGKRLLFTYEAGPTGYLLHDYLESQGETCIMVHPPGIPRASNDRVKTNRLDSLKLAEQSKAGQLKGIRVPTEPYRELRHLTELRAQYAQDQRAAKQRIKSLLLFEHIELPKWAGSTAWTASYRRALSEVPLKETLRFKLDMLLKDLNRARWDLLIMLRKLRSFSRQQEAIQKNLGFLESIPGFGFIVSTYLLARIGDPEHLGNISELGAFTGVVPSEDSTGEDIQRGSITHMGDRLARSLLIEAAWVAIRKDTELRQFFERLRAKRRGPGAKGSKIAIVAVARKLTHRVYRVLKDQRPYVMH